MERINTYQRFLQEEGIPVIRDYSVSDVTTVELKPWKRKGGLGAYLNLIGFEDVVDAYICEIPPRDKLLPQKHLYEELIYILSGTGASSVWIEGSEKKLTFEWQEGSLFAPPLNTWHQHFNAGDVPVRYLATTRAPVFMNLFHDNDFIFGASHVFKNRFTEEADFFSRGKPMQSESDLVENPKIWDSNFIQDCRSFQLVDDPKRGGLSTNVQFEIANGCISSHISQFAGGTYMKAHHHGPGAHLLCMSGTGYTLIWQAKYGIFAEGTERIKIDWKKNTVFSPPDLWFHQHFATSKEPAKLIAFSPDRSAKYVGVKKLYKGRKSIKEGGVQIEYEDEDPAIRRQFKEEIARNGVPWRMGKFFPSE